MRTAAALLVVMLGAWTIPGQIAADSPHPGDKAQPRTAVDWFRRADDLTNIRTPESPPFHLKVAFHAYPPIDFNQSKGTTRSNAPLPGHPFVIDGEGT